MLPITRPTLLLDQEKCLENIRRMLHKANKHNLQLRPHFKTHQSPTIGKWFKEAGVDYITVSSLDMAEAFASHGWKHILVAVPANTLELPRINKLAQEIHLELLIAQKEVAVILKKGLTQPVHFFIEVDAGYGRTGVNPGETEEIEQILVQASKHLQFTGFYTHAGHSYQARGHEALFSIHQNTLATFKKLKARYHPEYPSLKVVSGDTPTCSAMDHFEWLDALSPGNFVFYDYMQTQIGACGFQDVAVAIACPVIAVYPERDQAVIYGGAVHFSKDHWATEQGKSFGQLLEWDGKNWGEPVEGCYLKEISQEHGKVQLTAEMAKKVRVGDVLCFQPIHACLTANLHQHYLTLEGEIIPRI